MRLDRQTRNQPEVSVVVPLFNEQENVTALYRRLVETLESATQDFELVLVDDGSRDATAKLLEELHAGDARVIAIHLSRNFGHQAAISAGIDHARGRAVILMDGDLQDPPEVLPRFIQAWRDGAQVAYAIRTKRKESLARRIAYALYYRLLRAVSDVDIPLDSGDFCLMDERVVQAMRDLPERNRFVRGLRSFVGFRQVGIVYERAGREAGQPKYTLRSLWRLAMDGLFGFSSLPLSLVGYAGGCVAVLAAIYSAWLGFQVVRHGEAPGWSVATLALLICTSIQLFSIAILGEYVRRIFVECKARPTYIAETVRRQRDGLKPKRRHRHLENSI